MESGRRRLQSSLRRRCVAGDVQADAVHVPRWAHVLAGRLRIAVGVLRLRQEGGVARSAVDVAGDIRVVYEHPDTDRRRGRQRTGAGVRDDGQCGGPRATRARRRRGGVWKRVVARRAHVERLLLRHRREAIERRSIR